MLQLTSSTAPASRDQASRLREQTQRDLARLGAEVTRLARVAAGVHAAQVGETARDDAFLAQSVRDQASRLRLRMVRDEPALGRAS